MDAVDRLGLLRVGPGQLGEHQVGRDLKVDADPCGEQRAHGDLHVGLVGERRDGLVARLRRLVAADRHGPDAAVGERLLGGVQDVDVLGEEHDLADVARELRGVVGGEPGLGLADAPDHGEHVVAGLLGRRVLELAGRDAARQVVVDRPADRRVAARLERRAVAADEAACERLLRRTDRAPDGTVELDGQVRDAAGRDVRDDVDLAAAHDAHVDHRGTRGGGEAAVCRGQAGLLQRVHERTERLLVVDPPEELPDRLEVLDVVDERRPGEGHEQRTRGAQLDLLGERQHVA